MKPTQLSSALTIPTPAGNAIVSLTTTQTTPTTSSTTCALSLSEELIRTLREVAQQNAQLPQQHSKVFAKVLRPLLDVHRTPAQKALGSNTTALGPISSSASAPSSGPAKVPSSGPAKGPTSGPAKGPHSSSARNRPLPHETQPFPIGTSTDNSSVTYATPSVSVGEGMNLAEMEAAQFAEGNLLRVSSLRDGDRQTGKHPFQVGITLK